MCEFLIEHDSFTGFILTMYLLIIPMLCNMAWQDSKISYIKWYFTKGDYINYLGFGIFIIISSGSFIWYLALLFLELIVYIIVNPLVWLIEFVFFNRDCNNIISEELVEKERQREARYKKREYETKLAKYVKERRR